MMKKTLSALLALLMLVSLGACSFGENDAEKGKDNASETLDTVKDDVKDQTEDNTENQIENNTEDKTENNTEDLTEDTSRDNTETDSTQNDELISDEEAIALCIAGQETVHSWGRCAVIYDYNSEGKIIREFDDGVSEFTPLKKDDYSILQSPDIRGNTKIYYGDYEWMQENLKKIFTERFIEKHFNGFPWPFIYENGTVYFSEYAGGCSGYQTDINYTVINKTENEFSVVYETYHKDYDTHEILYSEPSYLGYMKFVKEGDLWLIDAYNSTEIIVFIYADDAIPTEFKDKVPEKYRDKSYYFEEEPQASEDEELISDEEAIELFKLGEYTSRSWLEYEIGYYHHSIPEGTDFILREYDDSKFYRFYPLEKTAGTVLTDPDLRGNDKIYYGDHEWMQENLRKVFTEKYIEKYFSYGYPSPLIYEDGVVYTLPYAEISTGSRDYRNYTVIHKTKDELAVISEAYKWDRLRMEWDYSEIDGLAYMKFVKIDGEWLIDEHYSAKTSLVTPKDLIPAEYLENIPEKYKDMTMYFEGYTGDGEEGVTEFDFDEFKKYTELHHVKQENDVYWYFRYLTKDDILAYDTKAEFIGSIPYYAEPGSPFLFYIRNTSFSLFGYKGFAEFKGDLNSEYVISEPDESYYGTIYKYTTENVIGEPNEMCGTIYKYIGDGSDILFKTKIYITIPNVTYNDYIYIKEKMFEIAQYDTKYCPTYQEVLDAKDAYGADTVLTGVTSRDINSSTFTFSLIDEASLTGRQFAGLDMNPLPVRVFNRLVITLVL